MIGNYVDAVSGTDWNTNHDSYVNVYECAGTSYVSSICTGALTNAPIAVESSPASKVGDFPSTGVELRVGAVGSSTCGLSTSPVCFLVVVGSSGDSTDVTLSFATPSVKVSKTTGVLGNYAETVTAKGFPIGDTIDAVECDSSVTTANLGTELRRRDADQRQRKYRGRRDRYGLVTGRCHHAGRRGLQRQRRRLVSHRWFLLCGRDRLDKFRCQRTVGVYRDGHPLGQGVQDDRRAG